MQDPWTLYWRADCLDSCIASKSAQDVSAVRDFWAGLAAELDSGSRVLDLATGNGTVPAAMLAANGSLSITGVDSADIDPLHYLSAPGELSAVEFLPNVDIGSLPFDDKYFDAVTSQFGIEYAELDTAIPEAVRVLKRGGCLQFLLHHVDSEIAVPARAKRREMDALLKDGGVLLTLKAYINGQQPEAALDAAGQAHLASDAGRSAQVSGQIFDGVKRAIRSLENGDHGAARELCDTMWLRLGADRERLRMLENAALDEGGFERLSESLECARVRTQTAARFCANVGEEDEFLVGWQYRGVRT